MTWPSAIFFDLFRRLGLLLSCTPLIAASLTGTVQLVASRSTSVSKHQDFSGVVVWLTTGDASEANPVRRHAAMLQKDKTFSPHILPITTNTVVDFPNLDPIFHNAFSNFEGKIFDVSLYPPGSSRAVRFDRPGIVRVFCNIHPSMSAIIVVLDTTHFATTDAQGSFRIGDLAPGDYRIHFFHERATPDTLDALARPVTVEPGDSQLPPVVLSEAGFIPVLHKNKYGRDYPGNADNTSAPYPLLVK